MLKQYPGLCSLKTSNISSPPDCGNQKCLLRSPLLRPTVVILYCLWFASLWAEAYMFCFFFFSCHLLLFNSLSCERSGKFPLWFSDDIAPFSLLIPKFKILRREIRPLSRSVQFLATWLTLGELAHFSQLPWIPKHCLGLQRHGIPQPSVSLTLVHLQELKSKKSSCWACRLFATHNHSPFWAGPGPGGLGARFLVLKTANLSCTYTQPMASCLSVCACASSVVSFAACVSTSDCSLVPFCSQFSFHLLSAWLY